MPTKKSKRTTPKALPMRPAKMKPLPIRKDEPKPEAPQEVPQVAPEPQAPQPLASDTIAAEPAIDAPYGYKADGTPKGKPGRPRGSLNREPPAPDGAPPGAALDAAKQYQAMAGMLVGTALGVAISFFGEEWKPDSKDEQMGLETATAAYLKSLGVAELSPGWVLLGTVAAYSLPRINRPNTSAKLAKLLGKKETPHKGNGIDPTPNEAPHDPAHPNVSYDVLSTSGAPFNG